MKRYIKSSGVGQPPQHIKVIKDYYLDSVNELDDDEYYQYYDLGFIRTDPSGLEYAMLPAGTQLHYDGSSGNWLLYSLEDTDIVIPLNNLGGEFERDFDEYFEII